MQEKEMKKEVKAFRMTYDHKLESIEKRMIDIEKRLREYNIRIGDNETQILNMKNITKEVVDNGLGDRKTK